jgi:hypothetical protein
MDNDPGIPQFGASTLDFQLGGWWHPEDFRWAASPLHTGTSKNKVAASGMAGPGPFVRPVHD